MKQWAHCLPANWVRQLPGGALVELVILEVAVFALDSLGVPTLEDKIVQGAVAELLSAVYEADFLGFSYGFRPGRTRICIKSFHRVIVFFGGTIPASVTVSSQSRACRPVPLRHGRHSGLHLHGHMTHAP
jgi:hypothetical protein